MSTIWFSPYKSPVGQLLLAASERGLCALEFDFHAMRLAAAGERESWLRSDRHLDSWRRELDAYFAGKLRVFVQPLDLHGTDFQLCCWNALLAIPYGETRSYADQARAIGSPRGFRAVGMANHDNPIAIIVPCHRVITSDHKLGGYGGGLDVKEKLLDMEGAIWRRQQAIEFAHAH
jgi:methylated-DNA-[protein]-cysteine S-methyltransferase